MAVTVRLHPAVGRHATCEGFAAAINTLPTPAAEPRATIEGELSAVDPCTLVPGDLMGEVALESWWEARSPFGIPVMAAS